MYVEALPHTVTRDGFRDLKLTTRQAQEQHMAPLNQESVLQVWDSSDLI